MTAVYYDDLRFVVPAGVYEPREDSRLLADVLEGYELEGKRLLDMGTGCGFLGVIAAAHGAQVTATDINTTAVKAAKRNADWNGVDMNTVVSDLFDSVDGRFSRIVCNPPYLPGSRDGVTMEQRAWNGGESARVVIDRFISRCGGYLNKDGCIIIVQSSLTGEEETVESFQDAGFDPVVVAREKVAWEELHVFMARNS